MPPSESGPAYAHSVAGRPRTEWEPLPAHAAAVGALAGRLAQKFGFASLGEASGLLHDFGKYKEAFQRYLSDPKVPDKSHSGAGAIYALRHFGSLGPLVAHVVAGHHAGLRDGLLARDGRLDEEGGELVLALAGLARAGDGFAPPALPGIPRNFARAPQEVGFQAAFLVRMLFACLVDADWRCTEAFYAHGCGHVSSDVADGPGVSIAALRTALDGGMARQAARRAERGEAEKPVNVLRRQVLDHVCARAEDPQGVFTLTVPTGGGKTLTSLAFALRHAERHGLDRVIVVIPFTSVIEQSAAVYRAALDPFGGEVLEHHSAFDDGALRAEGSQDRSSEHQGTTTWDARIVVTTAVQFFESLFSNRPSTCRKLHNIARSVVVLDEAQTLPLHLLRPCVAALKELHRNYGISIVLCTATQPALLERPDGARSFPGGFRDVVELAPDVEALFARLRRVRVRRIGTQDDDALAERFAAAPQALCIVNSRRHARELHAKIAEMEGARHLSTLMHAAHRSRVLAEIRADLKAGRPCRVVSTSLIEAGVDVDFPLVMRADAGLDQIAQAAGRLNREGARAAEDSLLLVFGAAERKLPQELKPNIETGREVMDLHGDACLEPAAIEAYFAQLYWRHGSDRTDSPSELDRPGVLRACEDGAASLDFPFETIARAMRLIDDAMCPVIVADDAESRHWLTELGNPASAERLGTIARRLQRHSVGVPEKVRAELLRVGSAQVVRETKRGERFVALANLGLYCPHVGLDAADPMMMAAEHTIL